METGKRRYGEGFGGLFDLDGEIVAGTLEGRHDFDEVRFGLIGAHGFERGTIVRNDVALLGDTTGYARHEIGLRESNTEKKRKRVVRARCTAHNEYRLL